MTDATDTEGLLRALAPRALGALTRRYGDFAAAEDALQEALVAATTTWPREGRPANPLGWLIRVASRRLLDHHRSEGRRRRREAQAAAWALADPPTVPGHDDTLDLMLRCCHPALTPGAAIPLTLRAIGGLTTREIATAFGMPEATMAQRISRAKAKVRASATPFALPEADDRTERLRSVRHVLYLMFNEGYASHSGPDLIRVDLSAEAIRLTRMLSAAVPEDPESAGLLALMLLTDARRPARTGPDGELIPLAEQDRERWDRASIADGIGILDQALGRRQIGEYQLQAAIAAAHSRAPSHEATDWAEISSLYRLLEQLTGNPVVSLNRAVAVAMTDGPTAALEVLDHIESDLGDHHRFHAVRAHLLELAGDAAAALRAYDTAAARATNPRERQYLVTRAAGLAPEQPPTDEQPTA
ncbi:RNA polymerase sigma factor [Egibacter rhizosphaerae]|uniref:RNA polymerase sigma factor n=1 Tax=Egibacter rhizosphaerae TaxID=1670831 RepID=A0A411YF53_9ACTN|nr:DUF6596 domain-containing protein [Egibacter rhizosphaerae]QBI19894.1 RNA polymerase sigma factor [Egibacter rhizosphaerae]